MSAKNEEEEEFPIQSLPLANDRILVFDPGEVTGICLFDKGRLCLSDSCTVARMIDAVAHRSSRVFGHVSVGCEPLDAIVIERFSLYPGKQQAMTNNALIPCQVIGILAIVLEVLQPTEHWMQSASQAKGLVTDDLLRTYDWYKQLNIRHEKDAARHGVYYLNKVWRANRGV